MLVSINMILDKLAEYHPQPFFEEADDIFFSGLRLYERGLTELAPENVYMCSSRELTDEAVESGCYFLCIHKMAPALLKKSQGRRVVLIENEEITLAELFNTIQSQFTELRDWHRNMHVSLIQNNDIQEILEMSEGVIGNPIVLVDLSFKLLAHTRNIITDDRIYNDLIGRGYHSQETIETLTRHKYVTGLKKARVIDIDFPPEITPYKTVTKTFYIGDIPYAYLRMICSQRPPSKSVVELYDILCESVEYYLQNKYSAGNVDKYMYEYVLVELIENRIKDEGAILERIKCVGLRPSSDYQLLKLVFEDEENTSLNYVLEQLRVIFPESQPFIYGSDIVMLMSFESKYGAAEVQRREQMRPLEEFLEYHRAYCGLSEGFETPIKMSDAYVQTTVSVEIGQALRAKGEEQVQGRIFRYEDYYVYHLITACAKSVRLDSLCCEPLLAMREQDAQRNTNYTGLLYTYLMNECKPTDTGKCLHMHRNNVIYHVERITEQLGVNLSDPETRLRLLLSYKVMKLL